MAARKLAVFKKRGKRMKGINGLILFIVGAGITVAARVVDQANLILFFYAGIVMATYGLGKYVIQKALFGGTKKEQKQTEQMLKPEAAKQIIKYCPKCGKAHGASANFCISCGNKL